METNENKDLIPIDTALSLKEKREQLAASITTIQYYPAVLDEKFETDKRPCIPMGQIASLGVAFQPVAQIFQTIAHGAGGSGFYWVDVPAGSHLAFSQGKQAYIGSALNNASNQIAGQASLKPLAFDPTLLFITAVLFSIDRKLTAIAEAQKEIMAFLQQKEKAIQRGNLIFLNDILTNYKFNYENSMFKTNNHVKVLDIKQTSEQSILFYKEQIDSKLKKKSLLHMDKNVRDQMASVKADLIEYRLALYLFAFSSFLEILLLENYENAYLDGVKTKILDYTHRYEEQYTVCHEAVEKYSKTSIQSHVLKGLSAASSAVGKTVQKIPVISNTQLDENLIEAGSKLNDYSAKRTEDTVEILAEDKESGIEPFIENITMIHVLYNQPIHILVDGENIYLPS